MDSQEMPRRNSCSSRSTNTKERVRRVATLQILSADEVTRQQSIDLRLRCVHVLERESDAVLTCKQVFYSSSAHIARLIESLSKNTEAATFNIKPKEAQGLTPDFNGPVPQVHISGHSHSNSVQTDSEVNFTVEERLDRMIDRVNPDR